MGGNRVALVVYGLVAALALIVTPAALGAVEVGSNCEANGAEEGYVSVGLAQSAGSPPVAAPSAGVVTQWRSNAPSALPTGVVSQSMKVLRPTGVPNQLRVVGESLAGAMVGGQNTFPTRIPVQAGDHFGVVGFPTTLYCQTGDEADVVGYSNVGVAVGGLQSFETETGFQAAVSAVIEPDADNDGYGDETQDKCPQSALYQGDCPTISLAGFPVSRKKSILLLVTASSEAPVRVFGQVKWGFKPKQKAHSSKTNLIIGLRGGRKTVKPGQIARFHVKLPKIVKHRLRELTPNESLKAKITASATNLAGRVTSKTLTVKLKGQAAFSDPSGP